MGAQDQDHHHGHGNDKGDHHDPAESSGEVTLTRWAWRVCAGQRGAFVVSCPRPGPDWNHANTKQPTPSRREAMPCFM